MALPWVIANLAAGNQSASKLDDNFNACLRWAVAGGTADALTAAYTPANTTLDDGLVLGVRAVAANATTTPTFAPDLLTARTITKKGGGALVVGDIPGNLSEITLRYNLANTRWELLNPAISTAPTLTNPANTTQALIDAASISWDASLGAVATVTLAGNRTMAAPTNLKIGGRYVLIVTQDAAGNRTLTWDAAFKGLAGTVTTMPQPVATANSITIFTFTSPDGTNLNYEGTNTGQFKAINAVRAHDAATGNVSYTGVGFKPKAIIITAAINATREATICGFATAVGGFCVYDVQATPGEYGTSAGACAIFDELTGSKSQSASLLTFDNDGCTLSWLRTGLTSAGNIDLMMIFLR